MKTKKPARAQKRSNGAIFRRNENLQHTLLLKEKNYDHSFGFSVLYAKITNFEELKKEVYKKIEEMMDICCKNIKLIIETKGKNDPKPYKSLLTEGCLETNRDFNDKGAIYDYYQVMFCGIPNLADSLVALNKFVFSDKKYTLEEIVYQLK